MQLETERLLIFPLSYEQLELYLQGNNRLEETLKLAKGQRVISQELLNAFHEMILPAVKDKAKDYLFSTLWTVVSKEQKQMVADLCFKGQPNEKGELEIGYGTYNEFQGQGYMTEAIRAIAVWAFSQPGVTSILAETEKTNKASYRILEKNNFTHYKEIGPMIWWRLEKPGIER